MVQCEQAGRGLRFERVYAHNHVNCCGDQSPVCKENERSKSLVVERVALEEDTAVGEKPANSIAAIIVTQILKGKSEVVLAVEVGPPASLNYGRRGFLGEHNNYNNNLWQH